MPDLAVVALTFGPIFLVELPDKTFIATLVLSTRYRPPLVWLGVGLAFAVQTLIAVTAGSFIGLLPEVLVRSAAAGIFLLGAVLLLRAARSGADDLEEEQAEVASRAQEARTGVRAVAASFVVLFAAEWGDLSQLLTVSRAAQYDDPVSVFLGAWGALLAVSGLAVLVGRLLLRHLRVRVLHYAGAAVCLVIAATIVVGLLT